MAADATIIVDLRAEWCGPRMRLTLAFEWQQSFESRMRFAKLAVDANPQTPSNNGVRGIPATCLVSRGRADGTIAGSAPTDRRRAVPE